MKALKCASSAEDKSRLSAKCSTLLEQAEQIKRAKDVGPLIQKMGCMRLSAAAKGTQTSTLLLSDRVLPTKEQILLHKSSAMHGFIFPPWKDAPKNADFMLKENQQPFLYVADPINTFSPQGIMTLLDKYLCIN